MMGNGWPDSPEGVVLALMEFIDNAENKHERRDRSNRPERERLLSLYAECLRAANGTMQEAFDRVLH